MSKTMLLLLFVALWIIFNTKQLSAFPTEKPLSNEEVQLQEQNHDIGRFSEQSYKELKAFLHQFYLIKTKYGYILGRNESKH